MFYLPSYNSSCILKPPSLRSNQTTLFLLSASFLIIWLTALPATTGPSNTVEISLNIHRLQSQTSYRHLVLTGNICVTLWDEHDKLCSTKTTGNCFKWHQLNYCPSKPTHTYTSHPNATKQQGRDCWQKAHAEQIWGNEHPSALHRTFCLFVFCFKSDHICSTFITHSTNSNFN